MRDIQGFYARDLYRNQNMKVMFLEAAVAFNMSMVAKYRFWRMACEWEDALYACLNNGEAFAPAEINKEANLYQWKHWSNSESTPAHTISLV